MGELHPLYFDEILAIIFNHLDNKDLLNSRRVCQKWSAVAGKIINNSNVSPVIAFDCPHKAKIFPRQTFCIFIDYEWGYEEPDPPPFANNCQFPLTMPIEKGSFLDIVTKHKANQIKFGPSIFTKFKLTAQNNLDEYQNSDFFGIVGEDIMYLKIIGDRKLDGDLALWLKKMKNLQTLKIPYCRFIEKSRLFENDLEVELPALNKVTIKDIRGLNEIHPQFYADLFNKAKNIMSLSLALFNYDGKKDEDYEGSSNLDENAGPNNHQRNAEENLIKILETFSKCGNQSTPKNLKFEYFTQSILEKLLLLCNEGFKIRRLKISAIIKAEGGGSLDPQKFMELLEKQKYFLESLEFERISEFVISFPKQLPRLQNLQFGFYVDTFHPAEKIIYSDQFPMLSKLQLTADRERHSLAMFLSKAENAEKPCQTLKSLKISVELGGYSKGIYMDICSKIFPNVKELDVRRPFLGSLENIWTAWPQLEKLKLVLYHDEHGSYFDDDIGEQGHDQGYHEPEFLGESEFRKYSASNNDYHDGNNDRRLKVWTGENSDHDEMLERKHPTIRDLKALKHLTLYCISMMKSGRRAGIFSNSIIYDGLVKMKQLKFLKIWEYVPNLEVGPWGTERFSSTERISDLTPNSVKALKEALKNTTINISSNVKNPFRLETYGYDRKSYEICDAKEGKKTIVNLQNVRY